MESTQLVTPKEAGAYLRLSAKTVRRHCRTGALPAQRVGPRGQWRIPISALRFDVAQAVESVAEAVGAAFDEALGAAGGIL